MIKFYLGTHCPFWLEKVTFPLFISANVLRPRKKLYKATCNWSLDSGAFSEIKMHGRFLTSEQQYVEEISLWHDKIGNLNWASPQDWMCEPDMLSRTGLSVKEHQSNTVENFHILRSMAPNLPIIPVIQGWYIHEYIECCEMYSDIGIDITQEPLVGVGSICRRQNTSTIYLLIKEIMKFGIKRIHGYGVKLGGIQSGLAKLLTSCDSMAWSLEARMKRIPIFPDCTHVHCGNCLRWAKMWRRRLLTVPPALDDRLF